MIWWNLIELRFGDRDKRERAAEKLGESKSQLAIPLLVTALHKDTHVWVRREATRALGKIGGSRAFEPLVAALKHND